MAELAFYSTNHRAKEVDIRTVILQGLAEDKGLYLPKSLPQFSAQELNSFKKLSYPQIAHCVFRKYLHGFIDDEALEQMCREIYDFPLQLQKLNEEMHIMWLTQGPTAAFKDFAALAMARFMQHFLVQDKRELLILTATSGDTGSAVANAFYGMNNIKVVILFPEKEVTERQRKLMTTIGKNITAIAVRGKFDDCQALVKDAFVDHDLSHLNLSSANSINFARLMPQIVYYVYAYSRLGKVNFSVPSGNFGDVMAGILGKMMGLPVERFIIAVNENDEFVRFYQSGIYQKIAPSRSCLSNAMNVGHPSNFARLVSIYGGIIDENGFMTKKPDMALIRKDIDAFTISDTETRDEIRSIHNRFGVVVEPHGAVGLCAYEKYLKKVRTRTVGVCLETADPAKFPEVIREVLGIEPPLPTALAAALSRKESMLKLDNDYQELKRLLQSRFG